jgi:hypothetical protein
MDSADDATTGDWSRDTVKIAVLTWISFLAASAFAMIFFAFVDPLVLIESIDALESRNAGYAVGFFLFWANGWIAGWFTMRLIRRKRRGPGAGKFPGDRAQ